MGLRIHLFLGLIKIHDEIKDHVEQKKRLGKESHLPCIWNSLAFSSTYKIHYFIFYGRKKILKKSMTDFAS